MPGQQAAGAESNGITAMPPPLERPALTGAPVTIDAIGRQTGIAEPVIHRGADHLPAVKASRPAPHGGVERYFAGVPAADLATLEATGGGHGRIE